jgi:diacylglycerol kinase family enzyme
MHVLVLVNPIAGAGRAAARGEVLAAALERGGHVARTMSSERGPPGEWLAPNLAGIDLLLVVGGDGVMRAAAGPASEAAVPVHHVPGGTVNLFAREWGMRGSDESILAAIDRWRIRGVDVGRANGEPFLLMASVGPDAEVVHDLAGRRQGRISQWAYLPPLIRQLRRWHPPRLAVEVDGQRIDEEPGGCVVVGNARAYGWRLDPAIHADMTDGRLDAVYFPARRSRQVVAWMLACRLHRHHRRRRLVYRQGGTVVITADEGFRFQIDGDRPAPSGDGGPVSRLELSLQPGALPVLLP